MSETHSFAEFIISFNLTCISRGIRVCQLRSVFFNRANCASDSESYRPLSGVFYGLFESVRKTQDKRGISCRQSQSKVRILITLYSYISVQYVMSIQIFDWDHLRKKWDNPFFPLIRISHRSSFYVVCYSQNPWHNLVG